MKQYIVISIFLLLLPLPLRANDTMCQEGADNHISYTHLKKSLGNFYKKHLHISRVMIVCLSALETLAVNSRYNILGIMPINSNRLEYVTCNLKITFPVLMGETKDLASIFKPDINIEQMLTVFTLFAQNYYLTKTIHKVSYPAFESLFLTMGGHLLAWVARFGWGLI